MKVRDAAKLFEAYDKRTTRKMAEHNRAGGSVRKPVRSTKDASAASQSPKMQVPLTSTIGASSHTEKPHKRSPRAIHSKTIGANQRQRHSNSKGGASPSRKPKTTSES
jgi:hypothetical protein